MFPGRTCVFINFSFFPFLRESNGQPSEGSNHAGTKKTSNIGTFFCTLMRIFEGKTSDDLLLSQFRRTERRAKNLFPSSIISLTSGIPSDSTA